MSNKKIEKKMIITQSTLNVLDKVEELLGDDIPEKRAELSLIITKAINELQAKPLTQEEADEIMKDFSASKCKEIKKSINELATECLLNSGKYLKYSDEDLMDASLIFMEVFMAKMYDEYKDKLTQEGMKKLATEAGKSFHQTIKLFTGIDMHKIT